ncbi:MAG TPA: PEGA domain-containing protein [Treponemataceae bacterium]|nr:PEGA domain-containing protein [Treponemataceae bacterium]
MSRLREIATLVLLVALSPLFADTTAQTEWVLAAERFSLSNVPESFQVFATTIPALLTSRLSHVTTRELSPEEQKLRADHSRSANRVKLVQERTNLILERDRILLSDASDFARQAQRAKQDDLIRKKNEEIREFDATTLAESAKEEKYEAVTKTIKLKNADLTLYERKKDASLAKSLIDDGVSGLITGKIEDLSGYMYVTVTLESGIYGMEPVTVSEAAPYDDVDYLVQSISERLIPEIAKRKPVRLELSVFPEDSRVFIDGRLLRKDEKGVFVFSGEHTLNVSAEGYVTANGKYDFSDTDAYRVEISLKERDSISVSFDTSKTGIKLYLGTNYYGEMPATVSIPPLPLIGKAVSADSTTWFIVRPEESYAKSNSITVTVDAKDTKELIAHRRSILYWSLGALYISLPVYLLSSGAANNMLYAYNSKRVTLDASYQQWYTTGEVSKYVSIALGVNVAFQLFRYLLAAEQVVPKTAH